MKRHSSSVQVRTNGPKSRGIQGTDVWLTGAKRSGVLGTNAMQPRSDGSPRSAWLQSLTEPLFLAFDGGACIIVLVTRTRCAHSTLQIALGARRPHADACAPRLPSAKIAISTMVWRMKASRKL